MRFEAPGIELDGGEANPRGGRLRGRAVQVRWITDPDRDPKALARLAAAIARGGPVAGPGLVTVLEACADAEPPSVVEDPAPGRTLAEVLAAGERVNLARLAHDLAAALAMLAERGLTHGALTPASVIITPDGGAKLAGLGAARLAPAPAYAAPESLAGRAAGAPADAYALALVLCEAAAGRALFDREVTPEERLAGWTPPPAIERALGPVLASAVVASLDLKPAHRPQPQWLLSAAQRAVPPRVRYPLAALPVALVFAVLSALLVSGAMRDLATPPRPRAPAARAPAPPPRDAAGAATRHLLREEYREAEALMRSAYERPDAPALVPLLYAQALEGLGRLAEARVAYERSIARDPRLSFSHLRLGWLLHKLGEGGAREATLRALELNPTYGCARLQLAALPLHPGDPDTLALERATDPQDGHAAFHLGLALWSRERFEDAERYLRRGAMPIDTAPGTQLELARFLEQRGRGAEALAIAEAVAAAVPRADAFALIARLKAADPVASSAALERALKCDPYTAVGLAEVARTLIRVNSTPERARTLLMRALEINPVSHNAWEDLAVVQLTLGDRETASLAVSNALRATGRCRRSSTLQAILANLPLPEDDGGLGHYARALRATGAEARREIAAALALEPGNVLYLRLDAALK